MAVHRQANQSDSQGRARGKRPEQSDKSDRSDKSDGPDPWERARRVIAPRCGRAPGGTEKKRLLREFIRRFRRFQIEIKSRIGIGVQA